MGGGGGAGVLGVGNRDARHGLGGPYTRKKVLQDPGPNTHTAATIRKEALTPPPPKGYPGAGGLGGSKSKKSLRDQFLVLQ